MRFAAILLLAMSACASDQPATYERGTLTRPPPAQQRPGVGLPIPGQPRPKPDIQPQPRPERYLPPSREPGIWASGTPGREKGPSILGVPLPIGDGLETPEEQRFTQLCADLMDPAAKKVVGSIKLTAAQKRCIAAKQYFTCMIGVAKADLAAQQAGAFDPERGRIIDATLNTADRFEKTMCTDGMPDVGRLSDAITAEATKTLKGNIQ